MEAAITETVTINKYTRAARVSGQKQRGRRNNEGHEELKTNVGLGSGGIRSFSLWPGQHKLKPVGTPAATGQGSQ